MWLTQDAYLPLFGPQTSLEAEVRISQWTQNEGLRYGALSSVSCVFHVDLYY
jgi:hypothetical protein